MSFGYFYGDQSESYSFYRFPKQLLVGEQFKRLSMDARVLYGLMLDRMGLSAKNGWRDEQGRVYIYYTVTEIQEDHLCQAVHTDRTAAAPISPRSVRRFQTSGNPKSGKRKGRSPDFGKAEVKTSGKPKCRLRRNRRK